MGSQTGETPYTVADVARFTGWSTQTVIRTFEHERGVLIHESTRRPGARAYRTIRIPRHVYRRVVGQRTVKRASIKKLHVLDLYSFDVGVGNCEIVEYLRINNLHRINTALGFTSTPRNHLQI